MKLEIKTWLYDIDGATREIESFIEPFQNFNSFKKDLKAIRAIERNIEIIGEAMNRIQQR